MADPKDCIQFILCGTQFASNLGSAVRVMKNMGFQRLALALPRCEVGVEARTAAMKGDDILDRADFFPDLQSAARELDLLVGATGRFDSDSRCVSCRDLAERVIPRHLPNRIGVAFGPEDGGLRKEEIDLCQRLVRIPTAPSYSSLNLAQAVGVVAYELHVAMSAAPVERIPCLAAPGEVQSLLEQAERLLTSLNMPASVSTADLMKRLHAVAHRACLETEDVNMFRGLLRRLARRR